MDCYWRKIDKFGEMPKEKSFLLMDEYGSVYTGSTAFDYYDAEYWHPMPKVPMPTCITNDAWVSLALRDKGH